MLYLRGMDFRFPKSERLCHQQLFNELMTNGNGLTVYPFRLVWVETELPEDVPYQIAISVSKRRFKKAVDRNRVKRIIREMWRHRRPAVITTLNDRKFALLLVYLSNEILPREELETAMTKCVDKWLTRTNAE